MARWRVPKCKTGKVAYRTQGRAIKAAVRIYVGNQQAAAPTATVIKDVYKCRCGAWHLTSKENTDVR